MSNQSRKRRDSLEAIRRDCERIGQEQAMKRGYCAWPRSKGKEWRSGAWNNVKGPQQINDQYGFPTGRYFL